MHRIAILLLGLSISLSPHWSSAGEVIHTPADKVVFQVSEGNPKVWYLAFNNIKNVLAELGKNRVRIELVVYGPGIDMLKFESELGDSIEQAAHQGVKIVACEQTMKAFGLGRDDMHPAIGYVPGGAVEIMRLQQQGYAYIRP